MTEFRHVKIHEDALDLGDDLRFTVSGDLRRPGSEWDDDNHDYSELIERNVQEQGIPVLSPDGRDVQFDTEMACFFAYTATREQAEAVARIADEVAERRWVS